ncbi:branched-chain amino acid ABC transporter permease [Arenibacterium halophilum]|jgi:branched-chain amino acid transport system permease protein|uniref:Branched-chain amino acid ABC transporter permease n=1 Tax=Arenibacterium halophilum TaxID=2583821 RepID=A0ABY2X9V1_9RHOB|nr:branched-chain amino acid ABC transporter permease [Arenibacterium halophilum]MAY88131.1 branched-chain amino acid ABC transporter permease [Pseudooceanicola sp.]TMV13157.1 branched-chain amino acid ABC transporter permease [Arenibacterium halophilum]|tara:strand:+ start:939 stop:1802 length:864 start_codon:yes stop_codon:yes gene_type:complete
MTGTLIIGLSIAMMLFLLAAGLTIIFGMLGVINFAHGVLYMVGGFIAVEVVNQTGNFWLSLLVAPLAVAALSALLEILLLRPLYDRDHVEQLLMTFGIILVLDEVVRTVWGLGYHDIPLPGSLSGAIPVFDSDVAVYRLFLIGAGLIAGLGLFALIEWTKLGIVLRGAMTHPAMVRSLGIPVSTIRTIVFALGGGLAALAGTIAAPLIPIQVGMGFGIIVDCFIVVILGGLGNIRGAIAAALLLGLVRAFGQQYFPEWIELSTYLVLMIVLLWRPQGLFTFSKGRKA